MIKGGVATDGGVAAVALAGVSASAPAAAAATTSEESWHARAAPPATLRLLSFACPDTDIGIGYLKKKGGGKQPSLPSFLCCVLFLSFTCFFPINERGREKTKRTVVSQSRKRQQFRKKKKRERERKAEVHLVSFFFPGIRCYLLSLFMLEKRLAT